MNITNNLYNIAPFHLPLASSATQSEEKKHSDTPISLIIAGSMGISYLFHEMGLVYAKMMWEASRLPAIKHPKMCKMFKQATVRVGLTAAGLSFWAYLIPEVRPFFISLAGIQAAGVVYTYEHLLPQFCDNPPPTLTKTARKIATKLTSLAPQHRAEFEWTPCPDQSIGVPQIGGYGQPIMTGRQMATAAATLATGPVEKMLEGAGVALAPMLRPVLRAITP